MNARPPILKEIREHLNTIINQDSSLGIHLWQELLKLHPADIARFLTDIESKQLKELFPLLPEPLRLSIFEEFSLPVKVEALESLDEQAKVNALNRLPSEELTDLFELLSDEDLKKDLELLHKTVRDSVLSLMKFDPESAGGIMDPEVFSLQGDFTVEKSISILQRLRPNQDVYQQVYVTNREHQLIGYIKLEDLVVNHPKKQISEFLRKQEFVAEASQDREEVAQQMVHYNLLSAPVVDPEDHFLGVISSNTLVDVLVEEAGEDVQKISALAPLKFPYFETSFFRLLFERGYILLALLLAQSITTSIMHAYEATLAAVGLWAFVGMLTSTGGNASSQTSAMAIQGMAAGDINPSNMFKFIRRELKIASVLAIILGATAFLRAYLTTSHNLLISFAISASLAPIVLVSVAIGSCTPLVLKRFNIDPAFAAGPFLATAMDILGVMIYCQITSYLLS